MRLTLLCAAWVAGLAAGLAWGIPAAAVALFLAASVCLAALSRWNRWPLLLPFTLALLLLGVLRGTQASHWPDSLSPWIGAGNVQVEGVIASDPEPRGTALRFRVEARRISDANGRHKVSGDILVTAIPPLEQAGSRDGPLLQYGDLVLLEGVRKGPETASLDYRERLARQGIQALMDRPVVKVEGEGQGWPHYALAYRVRHTLADALGRVVPEPQASIAQAILFGLRRDIPADVNQAFQDTGTTHLLAVSGMNMMMVLGMALPVGAWFFGRRRNLYLLMPVALLWAYAFLCGFSPSVLRAVIMASVYLAAKATSRPYAPLPSVSLTAALMTAQSPAIIYDLSFQLSFASVMGILFLWEPLSRFLERVLERPAQVSRWPEGVRRLLVDSVAVSAAAAIATAPILAFAFQRVSLLSVPATLLAIPVIPFIMGATFAASVASLIAHSFGQFVGWSVWLPVSYLLAVVEGMAKLPFGLLHMGQIAGLLVWVSYSSIGLALILLSVGGRRWLRGWLAKPPPPKEPVNARQAMSAPLAIGLAALASAAAFAWAAAASLPDGKLHVTVLDVGQGDAVLVQTPDGQEALVDGGPDPSLLAAKLGRRLPFWDRTLELVAVSHYHQDHLAGVVEAVDRYDTAVILDNPYRPVNALSAEWQSVIQSEGAKVVQASQGQEVRLGPEVTLDVLGPPAPLWAGTESDINNNSTVLRLRYRDFSMLLTGDLAQEGEYALVVQGAELHSTVLKVGHQGSATSSSQPFVDAVRPPLAVISVGAGNSYGHPADAALARLRSLTGAGGVLTTADHGDIELTTDGHTLWVTLGRR